MTNNTRSTGKYGKFATLAELVKGYEHLQAAFTKKSQLAAQLLKQLAAGEEKDDKLLEEVVKYGEEVLNADTEDETLDSAATQNSAPLSVPAPNCQCDSKQNEQKADDNMLESAAFCVTAQADNSPACQNPTDSIGTSVQAPPLSHGNATPLAATTHNPSNDFGASAITADTVTPLTNQYLTLANDDNFIRDYLLTNPKVVAAVLDDYVMRIRRTPVPTVGGGSNYVALPPRQPKSLQEARKLAESLL